MKIMFVDDRPEEILCLWQRAGCMDDHNFIIEMFKTIKQTTRKEIKFSPDVLAVGYGLNQLGITGADVIKAVQATGWNGYVIANSGGGEEQFKMAGVICDANIDRDSLKLRNVLKNIERK